MFFRRRRYCGLFKLLLLLLGFKAITRPHLSEENRREYRVKARKFRAKMREAYAVWDEDEDDANGTKQTNGTETKD